jgi:hypothetical protein
MTDEIRVPVFDPMTAKISCSPSLPGATITMPDGMTTRPAETPSWFWYGRPPT